MVQPADVPRILLDAARLMREGDIVVFGSAALAMWFPGAPSTRDVDLWCEPAERGDVIEAVMGELSWYHDRHDAYVEVWGPETFAAPEDWRDRARILRDDQLPGLRLIIPHPHDILLAKVERWEERDREHARWILSRVPLSRARAEQLAQRCPHRTGAVRKPLRCAAFEANLPRLLAMLAGECS